MKLRENSIAPRPLISDQLSRRESTDGAGPNGNFFHTGFNRSIERFKESSTFLGDIVPAKRERLAKNREDDPLLIKTIVRQSRSKIKMQKRIKPMRLSVFEFDQD